ncbi:hypothetical protein RUM44_007106 [Polyplax serrata]|uniref:Outer dynein arm-docking complex subunit 4 n=1 Tax=Polyplax serrata TaxID=468196 RepID=A0ABR1AZU5_POLSC
MTENEGTEKKQTSEETNENEENEEKEDEEKSGDEATGIQEVGIPKKLKKKKGRKKKHGAEKGTEKKKKTEAKPPSPKTISSKSTFAQIAKELKARKQAQLAYAIAMAKRRKKNRVLRDEEIYTDKDRAAAVNMGTSDIKQSLKMKKKLDKNFDCQIPDEGDPATLLALGSNELRSGDLKIALNFINKALELNPDDKNGLVARSKCYLSLGDPQLALKDAETALLGDKTFVRAIYQKAEALYHLGDFEHSLMYYHRGHRLRPELETFRLGVQKAQEAIENTIGNTSGVKSRGLNKKLSSACSSAKVDSNRNEKTFSDRSNEGPDTKRSQSSFSSENKTSRRSKSAAPLAKSSSTRFFGELGVDRQYLENLLNHPDLICSNQEAANLIKAKAEEGIMFLKSRQEFWKQQRPSASMANKGKEARHHKA